METSVIEKLGTSKRRPQGYRSEEEGGSPTASETSAYHSQRVGMLKEAEQNSLAGGDKLVKEELFFTSMQMSFWM